MDPLWPTDTSSAIAVLVVASVLYCVIGGIRRVYFSPLSKFPGPKFAALTLWNEFYWDVIKKGQFMWKIYEMHQQYGPIIRINPYEIHILDPEYYDELYAPASKKRDKYQWWTNLAAAPGSGFSTVPHDLHRLRRSALNPFFSKRSVTRLEPMILSKVEKLSKRFEEIAQTKEIVRFDAAFMALTMDIICDYAFANDRKHLDEPDFKLQWKKTLIGAFEGGALVRQFPWMLSVMQSLPLSIVSAMHPAMGFLFKWQNSVRAQIKPILEDQKSDLKGRPKGRTIFHTLRDSNLPPEEKTLDRLCDEGEILTGAGSETTAQAATRMIFYLKRTSDCLDKLKKELVKCIPDPLRMPSVVELEKLPYLTAVIQEGLRLSYGVTTRLPRVTHEELKYKEWVIPAKTPVSQTPYFILMDPSVFPEPEVFRPERWLEARKEGIRLDRYLVCFGKGSRQCLGMNLAYAEMYLALAMMVRRFDWELYETGLDDIICKHDFFVAVANLESKGVRGTLRKLV